MKIADLPLPSLLGTLNAEGLLFRVGPFVVRLSSPIPDIARGLHLLGAYQPLLARDEFIDFDIAVRPYRETSPPFRKKAKLCVDGEVRFRQFLPGQSYAMFEWGLNWCVAGRSDRYLLVHSAVVEKGGHALLLPAPPGSGKSTLCAALVCKGWRLLSDEVAILTPSGQLLPIPRPVSLKNASIDVIRRFDPSAVIGCTTYATAKGTVAYMRPPADSIDRQSEPAVPRWIVFPKFGVRSSLRFRPYSKARTLVYLAHNSFNYHVHGGRGFDLLAEVLDGCECFNLAYGSLEQALAGIDELAGSSSPILAVDK